MGKQYHIDTLLTRLGRNPKKYGGMVNTPIFKSSTIVYPNIEEFLINDQEIHTYLTYGRRGTPTVEELQNTLATLDNVNKCIVTASGLSAIMLALLSTLKNGDHALITDACYKCTQRSIEEEFPRLGISFDFYDATYTDQIINLIKPNTKIIYIESPGSSTFEVQDVPKLCKIASKHNIIIIQDNTWATPLNFHPFEHGVDIVVQSLTKYINGHSDLILGAVTFKDNFFPRIEQTFRNYASIPAPEQCYLVLRGIRTLKVRLDYQYKSALQIASWLEKHPKVLKVLYPPLASSPTYNLWKRDFIGGSGVFGVVLKSISKEKLQLFINSLELFAIGLSWGGFESLIIPYSVKNLQSLQKRAFQGDYIRLNIGLENTEDLIQDLDSALKNI